MSNGDSANPLRRVETLACRLFQGGLNESESAELDRLVREVEGAAEAYARYADVHAMLEFTYGQVESPTQNVRDIDREVFEEIIELAMQDRRRAEVAAHAEALLAAEREASRSQRTFAARNAGSPAKRVLVIPTWMVYAGGLATAALIALAFSPLIGFLSPEDPTRLTEEDPAAQQVAPSQPAAKPQIEVLPDPAPAIPNATVARLYNAIWDGRERIVPGMKLNDKAYRLTEGFVELSFANGASAIVQAPAEFRIASGYEMELDRGLLKATVPPGAEGFTVVTPTGRVVDLGTEFGVLVRAHGETMTDVITGRVRAELPERRGSVELVAGQGASLLSGGDEIELKTAQAELYPMDWSAIQTGVRVSGEGAQLFTPPGSVRKGQFEKDNRIVAFAERRGVVLAHDLAVSIVEPGFYDRMPQVDAHVIAAGTAVDSYLLHFDAVGTPTQLVQATATFEFDRPVLGLIVSHRGVVSSGELLRHPEVIYPHAGSVNPGLEGREHQGANEELDLIRLSRDGRTLTVRLGTTDLLDQMRVIVQARPVERGNDL